MATIAIVGLGYVGFPLALAFGKLMPAIGYDLSPQKIENYRRHIDSSGTLVDGDIRAATRLTYTTDPADMADADGTKWNLEAGWLLHRREGAIRFGRPGRRGCTGMAPVSAPSVGARSR